MKKIIKLLVYKSLLKDNKERLDKVLSKSILTYSRSCLKNWILKKRVFVNKKLVTSPKKKFL